ncbi:hypothetical protein JG687_00017055 [Phytophthora cactorum]|uniref:Uncharacterized protein n=1 Tax=Phytophthora cactorum TaxID=29920 RepID=A0A8T1TTG2_9STRA|nr:hypothetical protein JG687_00017055 [Phytophthora cactorum]
MGTYQSTNFPQRGSSYLEVVGHFTSRHSSAELQLREFIDDSASLVSNTPQQAHDQTSHPRSAEQAPRSYRDNAPSHSASISYTAPVSRLSAANYHLQHLRRHDARSMRRQAAESNAPDSSEPRVSRRGTTSCSENSKRAKLATRCQWTAKRIPMRS